MVYTLKPIYSITLVPDYGKSINESVKGMKEKRRYEDNPKSIKYYVKRYLFDHREWYVGKDVVDFPAGNGITSRLLKEIGAHPIPMDLFPEYFEIDGMHCVRANIREGLPLQDQSVDALICQEGMEHFSDQFSALKEFNRVLKPGGLLLITTPNYSNLHARLSYLLNESERFNSILPPNELDSIWMADKRITDEVYFGHIFLIGIQKLRTLARLSGFSIKKYHFTRIKSTSLFLFPFFYPFIWLTCWLAYRRHMRKASDVDRETRKKVYGEIYRLAINPRILIGGNLMVEFTKDMEAGEVSAQLRSKHKGFGTT